jgi:2-pyrone-4,6-dicarboxylate lactonase
MRYCLPPDPNTRKPSFVPPAGACDTHFHIFGPPEEFPFASTRQYTPPAAPLEHYLQMAEILGISRGVVVQPSVHGLDNGVTLDAVKRSNGRFLGVARIDDKTPRDELKKLNDAGIRGVRFNLLNRPQGNVKLDTFEPAVEHVAEFGWSIDLHIDPKNLLEQEKRVRRLPLPVIIDHMARVDPADGLNQPAFQLLLDLLKDNRFWVKLTGADKLSSSSVHAYFGLPFVDIVPFARALIAAAPNRVIWGTDWPHSNNFMPGKTPNDGDLLDLLAGFAPEESDRQKILVANPAALYGFV